MIALALKAIFFYALFVIIRYAFWGFQIYKAVSKHKKKHKKTFKKQDTNTIEAEYKVVGERELNTDK